MSDGIRVLVCGGRDYIDRNRLVSVLDAFRASHSIAMVIHGAANGADKMADAWALENKLHIVECPANWEKHGKAAGPMRNRFMLNRYKPDVVIAFPGGAGTANMVKIAMRAGVEIIEVLP